jgi:hypothetical protein
MKYTRGDTYIEYIGNVPTNVCKEYSNIGFIYYDKESKCHKFSVYEYAEDCTAKELLELANTMMGLDNERNADPV